MNQKELISQLIDTRHRMVSDIASMDRTLNALTEEINRSTKRLDQAEAPARMSVARASRYLGISRGTMYKLIDQGVVPSVECREDSSRVVVRRCDLDSYVANLPERHRTQRTLAGQMMRAS